MLNQITIRNFKSFREATLPLAGLTVLIGANASGKSNALEALQILSWMASGNRLDNLGSAIKDGRLPIRGTTLDLSGMYEEPARFELGCELTEREENPSLEFSITLDSVDTGLRVHREELDSPDENTSKPLYCVIGESEEFGVGLRVQYNNFSRGKLPTINCIDQQPIFAQLTTPARFGATHKKSQKVIPEAARRLQQSLASVLFLDPNPRGMRGYAFLGDRRLAGDGGNLSAVLHDLTVNRGMGTEVLDFIRSLPEQDIVELDYLRTPRNEVMLEATETFGGTPRRTAAALLSDGTLRVLAVAAALLSVPESSLVVIEEIDNGVHPSRARHLLERIQTIAHRRALRVVLTTHNPALLDALPDDALPDVVACYRDPDKGDSRLVRLEDLRTYPRLVAQGPLGRLVTEGVLERFLKNPLTAEEEKQRNLAWLDELESGRTEP